MLCSQEQSRPSFDDAVEPEPAAWIAGRVLSYSTAGGDLFPTSVYVVEPIRGVHTRLALTLNTDVFRDGPDNNYTPWKDIKCLPVVSVAPVRRPKLDETGTQYSFAAEKELMMEKMRAVLRIVSYCGHSSICMGAFGVGPVFRNPVGEVAKMWRRLLFEEEEFCGVFADVVFAIENSPSGGSSKTGLSDLDMFRREFDPSNIFQTQYR